MQKKTTNSLPQMPDLSFEFEQTWLDIASGYAILGKYETALQAYKNALIHNPFNAVALYGMGKISLALNDLKTAKDVIEKLNRLTNEKFKFSVLSGHLYLKENNIDKAFMNLKIAAESVEEYDSYYLYGIGLFYEAIENYDVASKIFLRHYHQYTFYEMNVDLLFRLGMIYKNKNTEDIALRMFNVLLQMDDLLILKREDVTVQIAHILEKNGNHEKANKVIEVILQKNGEHIFSHRLSFWTYYKENSFDSGLEYFHQLALKLQDPYLFYLLGRIYFTLNNNEQCFEMYRNAILKSRTDPWLWNSIGILYMKNKQYEEAKNKFITALSLDTEFEEGKHNLTICILLKNEDEEEIEKLNSKNLLLKNKYMEYKEKNPEPLDVFPDLGNSLYFKTQLFLGGPVYTYNKSKAQKFDLPYDEIASKTMN